MAPHFGIRTAQYTLVRFYGPLNAWELYDIKKDPGNMHNVYLDPKMKTVIARLKVQLKTQILRYEDEEALKIMESEK